MINRREFALGLGAASLLAQCGPATPQDYRQLDHSAISVRDRLFTQYPAARAAAARSKAYMVFPEINKASFAFGGATGNGTMFSGQGKPINHYNLSAASFGWQAGVQKFSLMILFQSEEALVSFRETLGFDVGFSLEYATPEDGLNIGNSANRYNSPVFALVFNQRGLMAGASIAGAKYSEI